MENKEVSIRIQDIFASFLKSIVWIAVVTAFFGALLGAYGVYKARHTTVNDSYATKITLKENEISDKELTIKNLEKANSTIRDVEIPYRTGKILDLLICFQFHSESRTENTRGDHTTEKRIPEPAGNTAVFELILRLVFRLFFFAGSFFFAHFFALSAES